MGIAQWNSDNELTTLVEVMHADGTIVEFYERACQVKADACTNVTGVGRGMILIEPLEDFLLLVLGYLFAVVADGNAGLLVVVGDIDVDVATRGGELEGVGKDIDNDLVEVLTVNPYRQAWHVVIVTQCDAAGLSLLLEE